jgi:regulatory protein
LLTARDHSIAELSQKLRHKGFESEKIEQVVSILCAHDYLNDLRFAESYIQFRARRGYGLRRIQPELRQRGVNETHICQALANSQICWLETLKRLQFKKFGVLIPCDNDVRARQMRYYQQRGFSYQQIQELWSKI